MSHLDQNLKNSIPFQTMIKFSHDWMLRTMFVGTFIVLQILKKNVGLKTKLFLIACSVGLMVSRVSYLDIDEVLEGSEVLRKMRWSSQVNHCIHDVTVL